MPLSLAQLESIRCEEFADDITIDLDAMSSWTDDEARDYFASGGLKVPSSIVDLSDAAPSVAAVDARLTSLLDDLGLSDLAQPLAGTSFVSLTNILAIDVATKSVAADRRAALLAELKSRGVASLAHRQKLATALAKAAKREFETPPSSAHVQPSATASPLPPTAPTAPTCAIPPAVPPAASPAAPLPPLPRPGAVAAARRTEVGPLPPYRRLTPAELERTAGQVHKGEWYGLELPPGLSELNSEAWGAKWLTRAFHATGVLRRTDRVDAITSFRLLELQGPDAQGGAGEKAILTVRYADADNGLHTDLFVKCPWAYRGAHGKRWRTLLSAVYGDGDGLELSTYTLLEGLLPMRSTQRSTLS